LNCLNEDDPITTAAAQKWLNGTARPTVDKIDTLAEWLNVSAQWLRFGIAESRPATTPDRKGHSKKSTQTIQPTADELRLLLKLRSLSEHQRNLIVETVEQFGLGMEMWQD
jgi:transcriptional regulator with XRE-family HTH domain